MKKFIRIALGLTFALSLFLAANPSNALVYGEFDIKLGEGGMENRFEPLDDQYDPDVRWIRVTSFGTQPNFTNVDSSNGYYKLNMSFPFEFNGEVFTSVWICVNGFIAFSDPPFVDANNPISLFNNGSSDPKNVIAPFWGDHYYRADKNGYKQSKILVKDDGEVLTVEWRDLNVNIDKLADGSDDEKSSTANFQVKIYKSNDPVSDQGDIEFCYGTSGRDAFVEGSAVGIKGESDGDFMNGLVVFDDEKTQQELNAEARTIEDLNDEWPPSGATDNRIKFAAIKTINLVYSWGDGDADLSQAPGEKHEQFYRWRPDRFVTVNDVRNIMRSVATGVPLDSMRRRQAYHADVDHNGRYFYYQYYNDQSELVKEKREIPWRDRDYKDNLPNEVSSYKDIFFYASEYDAAKILQFIAGRIPVLPWVYDTIPRYGKSAQDVANSVRIAEIESQGENTYKFPVYLNGNTNGLLAAKFEVDADVIDVQKYDAEKDLIIENNKSTIVLVGGDNYNADEPLCFVTVKTDAKSLEVKNIKYNDKNVGSFALPLTEETVETQTLSAYPNPFETNTEMTMSIRKAGYYKLVVFDVYGGEVATIAKGDFEPGVYSFVWDGSDASGAKVENGVYMYQLIGSGVSKAEKVIFNK